MLNKSEEEGIVVRAKNKDRKNQRLGDSRERYL